MNLGSYLALGAKFAQQTFSACPGVDLWTNLMIGCSRGLCILTNILQFLYSSLYIGAYSDHLSWFVDKCNDWLSASVYLTHIPFLWTLFFPSHSSATCYV